MLCRPMFCYETAINMLYWSALIYDYKQVSSACSMLTGSCAMCLLPDAPCWLSLEDLVAARPASICQQAQPWVHAHVATTPETA